jgi:pyrroline-5-carboxylate reductase
MTAAQETQSLADFRGRLVLVGAGKMGGAMLEGWLARGLAPASVIVAEPQPSQDISALATRGVTVTPTIDKASTANVVVLAIKPQSAPEVVPGLASLIGASTLLVSIMAGRTIAFLAGALGREAAIVRAMPNTPAAIGRGISVAVGNARVGAKERDLTTRLLAAAGKVEWVEDEALIDAVTAVSGSGPAYVFFLAEALAQAGIAAGLPPKLAATLARETVAGSGELLHRSPLDPATLRQNVTSPGGTTAAALAVLMGPEGLQQIMTKAIAAATKRSRELAG